MNATYTAATARDTARSGARPAAFSVALIDPTVVVTADSVDISSAGTRCQAARGSVQAVRPDGFATDRLGGTWGARLDVNQRPGHRAIRLEHQHLAGVDDLDPVVGRLRRGVDDLVAGYVHPDPGAVPDEVEAQPLPPRGQLGTEREPATVVAHAAEPGDDAEPGARQRRDVQAVAGVVLEIAQVHHRGFGEVVGGQPEMTDFGRHDRLGASRQ